MSLFGKLVMAAVNIAALPIEVVKNADDPGTERKCLKERDWEPYTQERLKKLVEDADEE